MEVTTIIYVLVVLIAILICVAVNQQRIKNQVQEDNSRLKKELKECKDSADTMGNTLRNKITSLEGQIYIAKHYSVFYEYLLNYLEKNWNKSFNIITEEANQFTLRLSYNEEKEEYEVHRYGKSNGLLTDKIQFFVPMPGGRQELNQILINADLGVLPEITEIRELNKDL